MGLLGAGKIPGAAAQIHIRLLEMYRCRIMDRRLDTTCLQSFLQGAPFGCAHCVHMVDVAAIGALNRGFDIHAFEKFAVACGMRSASIGPIFQMPELYTQDSGLEAIHAVIESFHHVMIFAFLPPVPQHAHNSVILGVIGHHHATFTVSAEVFAGVEAKAAKVAYAASSAPFVFCAMSLSGILYDYQAIATGNLQDRVHISRKTV